MKTSGFYKPLAIAAVCGLLAAPVFAQGQDGWPAAPAQDQTATAQAQDAPPPQDAAAAQGPQDAPPPDAPPPGAQQQPNAGPPPAPPQWAPPGYGASQRRAPLPPQITVPAGSFISVRVNERLASNHNHAGDTFTATLAEPLVVNGILVAARGENVTGVVTDAQKGSTQKLVLQLTELTLMDGNRVPLATTLVRRDAPGLNRNDAGTMVGTTAVGAGVGAVAAGGPGAAVGAAAGLFLGGLISSNHPSVVYPEQMLTFRIEQPITIDTTRAPEAFRYVQSSDYQGTNGYSARYQVAPYPGYYGYGYGYYGYPYYWGPVIGFGYWGGGWYGGRGWYGHPVLRHYR